MNTMKGSVLVFGAILSICGNADERRTDDIPNVATTILHMGPTVMPSILSPGAVARLEQLELNPDSKNILKNQYLFNTYRNSQTVPSFWNSTTNKPQWDSLMQIDGITFELKFGENSNLVQRVEIPEDLSQFELAYHYSYGKGVCGESDAGVKVFFNDDESSSQIYSPEPCTDTGYLLYTHSATIDIPAHAETVTVVAYVSSQSDTKVYFNIANVRLNGFAGERLIPTAPVGIEPTEPVQIEDLPTTTTTNAPEPTEPVEIEETTTTTNAPEPTEPVEIEDTTTTTNAPEPTEPVEIEETTTTTNAPEPTEPVEIEETTTTTNEPELTEPVETEDLPTTEVEETTSDSSSEDDLDFVSPKDKDTSGKKSETEEESSGSTGVIIGSAAGGVALLGGAVAAGLYLKSGTTAAVDAVEASVQSDPNNRTENVTREQAAQEDIEWV